MGTVSKSLIDEERLDDDWFDLNVTVTLVLLNSKVQSQSLT